MRVREQAATPMATIGLPNVRGHVNLALIAALEIYDGHEIQFGKNTKSL